MNLLVLTLFLEAAPPVSTRHHHSSGLEFIVAFPENIAYYHPKPPENKIQITSLYHNTVVDINSPFSKPDRKIMNMGQSDVITVSPQMELPKSPISSRTVQINSTKPITVSAINLKTHSIQTSLVVAVENMATEYKIPPVPRVQGTTEFMSWYPGSVPERGPFKVIVVNSNVENTVTLSSNTEHNVTLKPNQLVQFWVNESNADQVVKAEQPVAVLFSHPCATLFNCTCGMVFTPLEPANDAPLKFLVPPYLIEGVESEMFLLLGSQAASSLVPLITEKPLVWSPGPVIFYRPGLLLSIIPEEDFSSCFMVHRLSYIANLSSSVLLVVHRGQTDGVRLAELPLPSPDWKELKGTEYMSTSFTVTMDKNIIWHTSSKMAVYYMGEKDNLLFGNPAPSISKNPDYRGCVLSPEVLELGDVELSWPQAAQHCAARGLQLLSQDTMELQQHVATKLRQMMTEQNRWQGAAWIGLRRSSLTGEWYWVSQASVESTRWGAGEPGTPLDGQCATMALEPDRDFGWRDESCCRAAPPVCYKPPKLLSLD